MWLALSTDKVVWISAQRLPTGIPAYSLILPTMQSYEYYDMVFLMTFALIKNSCYRLCCESGLSPWLT